MALDSISPNSTTLPSMRERMSFKAAMAESSSPDSRSAGTTNRAKKPMLMRSKSAATMAMCQYSSKLDVMFATPSLFSNFLD
jgi:hypothetical protein